MILYDQDVKSPRQVRDYVKSLRALSPTPLWVAVDQEGGVVRRFREEQGFATIPSEASIGRLGDLATAKEFGSRLGKQLADAGVNLDFAPVVDLEQPWPVGIITGYERSLGSDPERVAALAGAILQGMRRHKVLGAAKHFPGEALAQANPHDQRAVAREPLSQIEARDLVPYRRLIAGGLDAVMLSHVTYRSIDPDNPASLSAKVIQGLLRGELGFQGLVICDDLQMRAVRAKYSVTSAAVKAAQAGVDLIVATGETEGPILDALVKAAREGKLPLAEARRSYERIQRVRSRYGEGPAAPMK